MAMNPRFDLAGPLVVENLERSFSIQNLLDVSSHSAQVAAIHIAQNVIHRLHVVMADESWGGGAADLRQIPQQVRVLGGCLNVLRAVDRRVLHFTQGRN